MFMKRRSTRRPGLSPAVFIEQVMMLVMSLFLVSFFDAEWLVYLNYISMTRTLCTNDPNIYYIDQCPLSVVINVK